MGEIRLDKNPIMVIILKRMGKTKNDFRTFTMEILGGRTGKKIKVKRHLKIHWPDDEDGGGGE